MHVVVNRNALLEVLSVASSIVSSRTTKEVLKCVRIGTAKDLLLLAVTDLEVALRASVPQVEIKKAGELLVPAEKLMSITRESADETLVLESDDQTCHVRGQDSHYEIYGQDPREFPPVPDLEGPPDIQVEAGVLRGLIERTIFAVAKENTRYAINGILWEKLGKKLALVATDGRRLARAVGSAEQSVGDDRQMIVPAKTVSVVQRVLPNVEGSVGVRFSENQIIVACGNYVISSALVEGHFPNYTEVIPKDNDRKLELDTDEFLSAVRRAALLTNEQSKGVRLSFDKEKLVLSSRAPEQGEATISMRVSYGGPAMDIGFNPAFLSDALKAAGAPTVQVELKEANRPGILKAGQEFLYVVMPVNLS